MTRFVPFHNFTSGLAIFVQGEISQHNRKMLSMFFSALANPYQCRVEFTEETDIDENIITKISVQANDNS